MSTRALESESRTSHRRSAFMRILFIACALVIGSANLSAPIWAAGDGKTTKAKSSSPAASAAPLLSSAWILPTQKNKSPILVQAGRSLPLKFELVENNSKLQSTDLVQVSVKLLNSCSMGATPTGTPLVLVSPAPVPTVSNSISSSSKDSKNLRVENSTFEYVWKVPKNQSSGCYQIEAKKGMVTVASPTIKVQGTK